MQSHQDIAEEMDSNNPVALRLQYFLFAIDEFSCVIPDLDNEKFAQEKVLQFIYGESDGDVLHDKDGVLFTFIASELALMLAMVAEHLEQHNGDHRGLPGAVLKNLFSQLLEKEYLKPLMGHVDDLRYNPQAESSLPLQQQLSIGVRAAHVIKNAVEPLYAGEMYDFNANYVKSARNELLSSLYKYSVEMRGKF